MVLFTPIRVVSPGFRQRGVEWDGGCEASANPSIGDRWRRPMAATDGGALGAPASPETGGSERHIRFVASPSATPRHILADHDETAGHAVFHRSRHEGRRGDATHRIDPQRDQITEPNGSPAPCPDHGPGWGCLAAQAASGRPRAADPWSGIRIVGLPDHGAAPTFSSPRKPPAASTCRYTTRTSCPTTPGTSTPHCRLSSLTLTED